MQHYCAGSLLVPLVAPCVVLLSLALACLLLLAAALVGIAGTKSACCVASLCSNHADLLLIDITLLFSSLAR